MKNIRLLILSIFLLGGCVQSTQTLSSVMTNNSCIQPENSFAFPLNKGEKISSLKNSVPLSPWQMVASLPVSKSHEIRTRDTIEFSRNINNAIELWVLRLTSQGTDENKSLLFVYHAKEDKWQEIPSAFEGTSAEINRLYLGNNEKIWALGTKSLTSPQFSPLEQQSISLYNEQDQKFQPVVFHEDIPSGWIVYDQTRNLFWIFQSDQAIYSVDSETLEIKKQIELPFLNIVTPTSITISKDGSIYIINADNLQVWTQSSVSILKFNPENKNIEKIILPDALILDPVLGIYSDKSGNIWLGDQAWKTPNSIWYEIIRSPVFVTHMPESSVSYQWDLPEIVQESSDGRLWYKSFNGMISLDPQKGEWCWFTTYQSNIVEDSGNNLWMIADGKLYKNPLNP